MFTLIENQDAYIVISNLVSVYSNSIEKPARTYNRLSV